MPRSRAAAASYLFSTRKPDIVGWRQQGKGGLPRRWFESTALFQARFSLGRRARLAMVAAVRTLRDECARFEHASTLLDPFGTEERF